MGLSYQFTIRAPASTSPEGLESFLKEVERDAKHAGFDPTHVFRALFDTAARRDFARRLTIGLTVEDERLKGVALPVPEMIRDHDPVNGSCRLVPEEGVILVVTDEHRRETCFSFLRYPERVLDVNGKMLAETNLGSGWFFQDFLKSPDPRYRRIIALFRERGFVVREQDDFTSVP